MTTTEEVTTPAVEAEQIPGTPIMTSGTPERTETITTEIPRTTADTAMSEFFVSKTGVLDIGKTSDIEKAASNFRGFGEGMTTDALGNTTLNIMGNKAVKSAKELVKLCIEGLDELTVNGADEKAAEQGYKPFIPRDERDV